MKQVDVLNFSGEKTLRVKNFRQLQNWNYGEIPFRKTKARTKKKGKTSFSLLPYGFNLEQKFHPKQSWRSACDGMPVMFGDLYPKINLCKSGETGCTGEINNEECPLIDRGSYFTGAGEKKRSSAAFGEAWRKTRSDGEKTKGIIGESRKWETKNEIPRRDPFQIEKSFRIDVRKKFGLKKIVSLSSNRNKFESPDISGHNYHKRYFFPKRARAIRMEVAFVWNIARKNSEGTVFRRYWCGYPIVLAFYGFKISLKAVLKFLFSWIFQ